MNAFLINHIKSAWVLLAGLILLSIPGYSQTPLMSPYNGSLDAEQSAMLQNLTEHKTTKRIRVVFIDVKDFNSQNLLVNPFPEISIPLTRIDLGPGGISLKSWSGNHPASYSSGSFVLMGQRVSGHVSGVTGNFEIFPMGNEGVHAVIEHDNSAFEGCGNAAPEPEDPGLKPNKNKERRYKPQRENGDESHPSGGWHQINSQIESNGAECFVRVLVGYTSRAQDSTQAVFGRTMIEHVSLAVLESNQGYANSNVEQRMELAYMYLTDDDETGSACNDLDAMNNDSDGKWDEMYSLRSTYRADMTCLITGGLYSPFAGCNSGGLCGRAFGFDYTDPNNMFQVSEWGCATGNFTFAHEFGHTQGCRHDNDNTGTPFSYARGFNEGTNFRTIMAVCCTPTRINWWSNPDINFMTFGATGTASRDNARALDVGDATVSHHQTTSVSASSSSTIDDDHWANVFATDDVSSSNTAEPGSKLELKSFGYVTLTPGFHAKAGCNMRAWKEDECPANTFAKVASGGNSSQAVDQSSRGQSAMSKSINGLLQPQVLLYPNPVSDHLTLDVTYLNAASTLSIKLADPSGRILRQLADQEAFKEGRYQASFATNYLTAGMYYLIIEVDGLSRVLKIVKSD